MDNQQLIELLVPSMPNRDELPVWHNFSDHCWKISKPTTNSNYMNYVAAVTSELKAFSAIYDFTRRTIIFENIEGYTSFILT